MKTLLRRRILRSLIPIGILICASVSPRAEDRLFSLFESSDDTFQPANYVLEPIPTFRIYPADVVQKSIRHMRLFQTNNTVMWKYTEEAAKRMLAFRETHKDQKIRVAIGEFVSRPMQYYHAMPSAENVKWTKGWLEHRTDKFFSVSREGAQLIVAGLQGKTLESVEEGWNRQQELPQPSNFDESPSMRQYQESWENHLQNPNSQIRPSLYPTRIEKMGIR